MRDVNLSIIERNSYALKECMNLLLELKAEINCRVKDPVVTNEILDSFYEDAKVAYAGTNQQYEKAKRGVKV